ncbi:hypothetical protein [Streptomyces sp. NPDC055210]
MLDPAKGWIDAMLREDLAAPRKQKHTARRIFQRLRPTAHDVRRIYSTETVHGGLPIHVAAKLLGQLDLNTTQAYAAVHPEEVIRHYRQFVDQRRTHRPSEAYREPSDTEWQDLRGHFSLRKVALGTCDRPYGTPCQHENVCEPRSAEVRTGSLPLVRSSRFSDDLGLEPVIFGDRVRQVIEEVIPETGSLPLLGRQGQPAVVQCSDPTGRHPIGHDLEHGCVPQSRNVDLVPPHTAVRKAEQDVGPGGGHFEDRILLADPHAWMLAHYCRDPGLDDFDASDDHRCSLCSSRLRRLPAFGRRRVQHNVSAYTRI